MGFIKMNYKKILSVLFVFSFFILAFIFYLELNSYFEAFLYSLLTTFLSSIICITIPFTYYIKNKKYLKKLDYKKGRDICIQNCIINILLSILFAFFWYGAIILCIPSIEFYFINKWLFVESKEEYMKKMDMKQENKEEIVSIINDDNYYDDDTSYNNSTNISYNGENVVWIIIKMIFFGYLAAKSFVVGLLCWFDLMRGQSGALLFVAICVFLLFFSIKHFKINYQVLMAYLKQKKKLNKDIISRKNQIKKKNVLLGNCENKKVELIRQYKELLDLGAITEEEYNIKKKELL